MTVPYRANVGDQQYVTSMRQAYYGLTLYDPDYALSRDPRIYDVMLRDPIIKMALNDRYRAVVGTNWRIEAPKESEDDREHEVAEVCARSLSRIKRFSQARRALATSWFRGRSYVYIEGARGIEDPSIGGEDWERELWSPHRLRHFDKRRVRFVPERDKLGRVTKVQPYMAPITDNRLNWVPVNMDPVVEVKHEDLEERLGYGRGGAETIYYYFYAKSIVLEQGLNAVETWARGVIVGSVKRGTPTSTDKNAQQVAEELLEVLRVMRSQNVVVVDSEDEIDVKWPDGSGFSMVLGYLNYLDSCMVRFITGAELPTGGGTDTGSMARAQEESKVSEDVKAADRRVLDEALTDDLIGLWWKLNYPLLVERGYGDCRRPVFVSAEEKRRERTQEAEIIERALRSNVALKKTEVYERLDFTQPQDGDEVIEAPAPSMGGFGLPGGEDRGADLASLPGMGLDDDLPEDVVALMSKDEIAAYYGAKVVMWRAAADAAMRAKRTALKAEEVAA